MENRTASLRDLLARRPKRLRLPSVGPDVSQFEGGTLEKRAGLSLLKLRGNYEEMGRQHGSLFPASLLREVIEYYAHSLDRLMENATRPLTLAGWLGKLLGRGFLLPPLFHRLARHLPPSVTEEARGFSQATGIPQADVLKAGCVADLFLFLAGTAFKDQKSIAPDALFAACSSVAVWGAATCDGALLHGRNMDFWGIGKWDAHPTVILYQPTGELSFAAVTSAGVGTGGITAMNEAGLTLALHMNLTRDVSLDGTPMIAIGHEIIRRAESLEDAIELAGRFQGCGGFSIFMTDAKAHRAANIEFSGRTHRIRLAETDNLFQTNHYCTPSMKASEIEVNTSVRAHTLGRYLRINDLVREHYGHIDVRHVIDFLGDHYDPYLKRERPIGSIVTQPNNVSSAVFRPESRELWVAVGPAPANHGRFLRIDLEEEKRTATRPAVVRYLEGNLFTRGPRYLAYKYYLDACRLSDQGASSGEVLSAVRTAADLDSEEPIYSFICGIFLLKQRSFPEAIQRFDTALRRSDIPHKMASVRFWKGVAMRLIGREAEADAEFRRVEQTEEVGEELLRQLRKRANSFTPSDLERVHVDLLFADVILFA